jgi:cytochrome c peroxidase
MPDRTPKLILTTIVALGATACGDGLDLEGDGAEDAEPIAAAPEVPQAIYDLGQALFFDNVLSGNEDLSCATCHHPTLGTDDDLALSRGVGGTGLGAQRQTGAVIPRNAPALFNLHLYESMFWDSRVRAGPGGLLLTPAGDQLTDDMASTLEYGMVAAQAMFPVTSRDEMRGEVDDSELGDLADDDFTGIWAGLMVRLGDIPEYVLMFEAAYPDETFESMTFAHAANAIAGFEIRAFERRDSPYQAFLLGDDSALTQREHRGMRDFFEAGCGGCHRGPLLSDFRHHNTGLAQFGPGKGHGVNGLDDYGREGVTGDIDDRYAFRTTPLVNVQLTGPYGHAGQLGTLRDFVAHYRDPRRALMDYEIRDHVDDPALWDTLVPNRDAVLERVDGRVRDLRRFDVGDVTAFLEAATATSANDLSDTVPDGVPSGLVID